MDDEKSNATGGNQKRGRGGKRPGAGRPKGSRNKAVPRRDFERAWVEAALRGDKTLAKTLETAETERLRVEFERLSALGGAGG